MFGTEEMFGFERLTEQVDATMLEEFGIHCAYAKLAGYLSLEELFTVDTVYCCAVRASHGFMGKRDTVAFMKEPWENSKRLCDKVLSGSFKPKYYSEHKIIERGKERMIKPPTFECKVVQKVICDYIIRPVLEPKMISTSYAGIRGRGTAKMRSDIMKALNNRRYLDGEYFVVLTDYKGYFGNIDVDILFEYLAKYIYDARILDLMRCFSPEKRGLSLGNELSQLPASFFPSPIDHAVKDYLGVKDYFRYMDDTLAIVPADMLDEYKDVFIGKSNALNMTVKKVDALSFGKRFMFCKVRYIPTTDKQKEHYFALINPTSVKLERRKLKKFKELIETDQMPQERALDQYVAVRGMIESHENTYNVLKELDGLAAETIGYEKVKDDKLIRDSAK